MTAGWQSSRKGGRGSGESYSEDFRVKDIQDSHQAPHSFIFFFLKVSFGGEYSSHTDLPVASA